MINYGYLNQASLIYQEKQYKRIEAPWLVTKAISDITKPADCSSYIVKKDTENTEKTFVASGEQSFLYLINKDYIPCGKYQTITPCMRDNAFDETHTKYFMKLELIEYMPDFVLRSFPEDFIKEMMEDVIYAWCMILGKGSYNKLKKVKINDTSWDIEYDGIELGSYGFRSCSFCSWIYGTGIAEPRFSRVTGDKHGLS